MAGQSSASALTMRPFYVEILKGGDCSLNNPQGCCWQL